MKSTSGGHFGIAGIAFCGWGSDVVWFCAAVSGRALAEPTAVKPPAPTAPLDKLLR